MNDFSDPASKFAKIEPSSMGLFDSISSITVGEIFPPISTHLHRYSFRVHFGVSELMLKPESVWRDPARCSPRWDFRCANSPDQTPFTCNSTSVFRFAGTMQPEQEEMVCAPFRDSLKAAPRALQTNSSRICQNFRSVVVASNVSGWVGGLLCNHGLSRRGRKSIRAGTWDSGRIRAPLCCPTVFRSPSPIYVNLPVIQPFNPNPWGFSGKAYNAGASLGWAT
ncbi:hypothetical protein BJ742DRAFT_307134 [Cladochytrium replicatum]|nr:hypothetical protein BJ742DRAFT_307134 [Cladochytrium replicatum]